MQIRGRGFRRLITNYVMTGSAALAAVLVLMLVTLVVNGCARLLVWSITRGTPARVHAN